MTIIDAIGGGLAYALLVLALSLTPAVLFIGGMFCGWLLRKHHEKKPTRVEPI